MSIRRVKMVDITFSTLYFDPSRPPSWPVPHSRRRPSLPPQRSLRRRATPAMKPLRRTTMRPPTTSWARSLPVS
ncbi:hypothetical protein CGCF413_v008274 [Colletotrichum fructicola]|nr:hypothetical protein CGCF413_v008274 [Colletotrichum fructicola]